MSEHTPGPWVVHRPAKYAYVLSENPATCGHYVMDHCGGHGAQIRHDADARLIAAAPDLLEAARLTEQHFSRNNVSGNFQGDDEHEVWTALRKAIAKAEGR